jgi:signal transduction histidine kinase
MATKYLEANRVVGHPRRFFRLSEGIMPLLDRYSIDEEERNRGKAFLGITQEDAENLQALRLAFQEFSQEFAERFYQHLLSQPRTASLLQDPQQLEALKKIQANYFSELLESSLDDDYYEKRLRVGLAHQRIGLEPFWYLGAYNQYIQLTFPVFVKAFGNNLEKVLPSLLSLVKVIFLDISLALRTYYQSATEQLRHHNEELKQALGLYWQAQRREEQLRKLVSHEIRGGLAAMITSLEDLLETVQPSLEAPAIEQLEGVTKRCWSLTSLLGEMLTTSDGSGPRWVETSQIFETLRTRFGLYTQGGQAFELKLPEIAPRLWADPLQLREVFANLVSNAVRYMDKAPGIIEISCRPEGEFYVFCVADNGPGVPASVKARIFEPFVRGHSEGRDAKGRRSDVQSSLSSRSSSMKEGTGLGLYFVRTVVEQGGGKVWLESKAAQGSLFYFSVPRVPPSEGRR